MHVTRERLCTLIMNTDLSLLKILLLLTFWSPAGEITPNFTDFYSIFNTSWIICVTVFFEVKLKNDDIWGHLIYMRLLKSNILCHVL